LHDVKRLDAEWIARGEKLAIRKIDGDKGVHAVEPLQSAIAPGLQRIGEHFGVRMGAKADAERFHLVAQFDVVIDLAVERHCETAIKRNLRLGAVLGIDDA
jgi:hypothetical protein